ncbi:uncharacterized protein CLAFUR5_00851 [Fulvia fulva]|uniref:Uncharacterized protein n=1 Tax=Passalora fulva TaxID=5499 RepID=A0A9Q8P3L8_PASFU|nr:uncharacterized protein CLAFUR5_00851 [Fulvia fulva]KAK4636768.1 hypothetical protein CLAFUR0_00849 [Fulvia fulva]UJO11939.1 hypothetical protein CLAFUR5_00851 [Fulvia fulva]
MATSTSLKELEDDPRLFLYTSLTAGSSHIITATSRMETILKANRIPFQAIDTATDTKARQLWQRRAGQRKLPGLVKEGFVIGDLNEVEEWNEFGELKENIGDVPAHNAAVPAGSQVGVQIAATLNTKPSIGGSASKSPVVNKAPQPTFDKTKAIALPGAAEIAERNKAKAEAAKAEAAKSPSQLEAINPETLASSPEDKKEQHMEKAKDIGKSHPNLDHLSAPASRIQSGTATPAQQEGMSEGVLPLTQATKATEKSEDSKTVEDTKNDEEQSKPAAEKKADEGLKVHFEKKKKPADEVKKDEPQDVKTEAIATKGVEELKLDQKEDMPKPQEEAAKQEDNVGKSVED